jgi:hypothetical protein
MVRAGWGVVYTQKGAVYGSGWEKETYLAAEAEAQSVPFLFFFCFFLSQSLVIFTFTNLSLCLVGSVFVRQGRAEGHVATWHGHRVARGL